MSSLFGSSLVINRHTDHLLGPMDAPVTLVEYGDFECPDCAQAHGALRVLRRSFGEKVLFVFRHFPLLEVHRLAMRAAEAAEAAAAQGRFWAMCDVLFLSQTHLEDDDLIGYASALGLDVERFRSELRNGVYQQRVTDDVAVGRRLRLRSTPSFFVNGSFVDVSFGMRRLHDSLAEAITA